MEKELRQTPTSIIKVVLFGPESTGKTTLSQQLADHYNTIWIPEFAREYLQEKWNKVQKTCEPEDILPIAKGQLNSENEAIEKANKVLFSDTDILATKVYSQEFYDGFVPEELEEAVEKSTYHLYLLTYIDTPWVADDLRDRPNQRKEMFYAFKEAVEKYDRNYIVIKGDKEERLQNAIRAVDGILAKNFQNG